MSWFLCHSREWRSLAILMTDSALWCDVDVFACLICQNRPRRCRAVFLKRFWNISEIFLKYFWNISEIFQGGFSPCPKNLTFWTNEAAIRFYVSQRFQNLTDLDQGPTCSDAGPLMRSLPCKCAGICDDIHGRAQLPNSLEVFDKWGRYSDVRFKGFPDLLLKWSDSCVHRCSG